MLFFSMSFLVFGGNKWSEMWPLAGFADLAGRDWKGSDVRSD